jgi:cell division protein FtsI (penicillin-binding protein 3)
MKNFKFNIFFVYVIILSLGITVMYRIVSLAIEKGKYYRGEIADGKEMIIDNRTFRTEISRVSGKRGNIFSDDGTVLLSNIFIYDLYWYPSYIYINDRNDSLFMSNVDSLIRIFHRINPKKSISTYNKLIKQDYLNYKKTYKAAVKKTKSKDKEVKKEGYDILNKLRKKYVQIKVSNVNRVNEWVRQKDINEIDSLFANWKGNDRFRGGCEKDRREVRRQLMGGYPKSILGTFESIAAQDRTDSIIFKRGIEGYCDTLLRGETVSYRILKVNNETVRLKENKYILPNNGCDIITTINNDIQRVTKNALEKQLLASGALWGCAIVMEVKSGEIKAICNLDKVGSQYEERIDHATTERYEPGSTFKLITLLAALESGKIDTNTIVECDKGNFSLKRAFVISDNRGLYHAAKRCYPNISAFLLALKKMSLEKDLKIETAQAQRPILNPITAKESDYRNVTHGYSVKMPPVYMLAYYNAVANNGIYIKPILIKSLSSPDKGFSSVQHEVINSAICSPTTIAKAKSCLEAVVTEGSAKRARDDQYFAYIQNKDTNMVYYPLIAGKTGTAFIYDEKEKKYSSTLKNSSFIGYFPSQSPKYTCLVLISGTSLDASVVAVPVCKEIAEKLNMHDIEIELSESDKNTKKNIPTGRFVSEKDINIIYNELQIPLTRINENADKEKYLRIAKNEHDEVVFVPEKINNQFFSELKEAKAKDAVYLLEKMGFLVEIKGRGKVNNIQIIRRKAIIFLDS